MSKEELSALIVMLIYLLGLGYTIGSTKNHSFSVKIIVFIFSPVWMLLDLGVKLGEDKKVQ